MDVYKQQNTDFDGTLASVGKFANNCSVSQESWDDTSIYKPLKLQAGGTDKIKPRSLTGNDVPAVLDFLKVFSNDYLERKAAAVDFNVAEMGNLRGNFLEMTAQLEKSYQEFTDSIAEERKRKLADLLKREGDARVAIRAQRDADKASINKKFDNGVYSAERENKEKAAEFTRQIKDNAKKIGEIQGEMKADQEAFEALGMIGKMIERDKHQSYQGKAKSAVKKLEDTSVVYEEKIEALKAEFAQKVAELQKIRDAALAPIEPAANEALGASDKREAKEREEIKSSADNLQTEVNQRYSATKDNLEKRFEHLHKELLTTAGKRLEQCRVAAHQFLDANLTKEIIVEYRQWVDSVTPSIKNYRVIEGDNFTQPPHFLIGDVGQILLNLSSLEEEMHGRPYAEIEELFSEFFGITVHKSEDTFFAALPQLDDMSDGFGVMIYPTDTQVVALHQQKSDGASNDGAISGSDDDTDENIATAAGENWVNHLIRSYLLRSFMAFPPAKLEAVIIDPLAKGLSFDGLTQLVDKQHERIIDTRVWSREDDIGRAVATLASKLATASQQYGSDKAAYFLREPIRAIAIADFPRGFTDSSLADLASIMHSAMHFGVLVYIGVNPSYVGRLAENNDYHSIINNAQLLRVEGNQPSYLQVIDTSNVLVIDDERERSLDSYSGVIISILREAISKAESRVEQFAELIGNINDTDSWCLEESEDGVIIPIGIKGAGFRVDFSLGEPRGSAVNHGLLAGITHSGKSNLLRVIIMSILLRYPPEDVQLMLIDFKDGVEFRKYANYYLPSFKDISIGTEPEFALAVLRDLLGELERRAAIYDFRDIDSYRRATGQKMPNIILIFDEIQELARADRTDKKTLDECLGILDSIARRGAAFGIHLLLASQNLEGFPAPRNMFTQMPLRILMRGTDPRAGNPGLGIMGDDQQLSELQNQPPGSAIISFNEGAPGTGVVFQVSLLDDDTETELLEKLSYKYQRLRDVTGNVAQIKLLFTNIEHSRFHPFNQLILEGSELPAPSITDEDSSLALTVGNNAAVGEPMRFDLFDGDGENLLLLGTDEQLARSIMMMAIFSRLYGLLTDVSGVSAATAAAYAAPGAASAAATASAAAAAKPVVWLFDLYDNREVVDIGRIGGEAPGAVMDDPVRQPMELAALPMLFPGVLRRIIPPRNRRAGREDGDNFKDSLDLLYQEILRRGEQPAGDNSDAPVLLCVFYGIHRGNMFATEDVQAGGAFGQLSLLGKLQHILRAGPKLGVHSIVWGSGLAQMQSKLDANDALRGTSLSLFNARIVFSASEEEFRTVVSDYNLESLTPQSASYLNIQENDEARHFRPYVLPPQEWVMAYATTLERYLGELQEASSLPE